MTAVFQELRLPNPTPDELGAVLRDCLEVTQRLADTHEKLQAEVTRLRSELADKNRELERARRLAELGEMAAGVAHEVRNPLGAIQLYSNLLRQVCGPQSAAGELIGKMDAGIRAIDAVVQDTLALAPRELPTQTILVRDLLTGAADLSSSRLSELNVQLALDGDPGDAAISGAPVALQRVLVNLIVNAAEASTAGDTVDVSVLRAGGETRIVVADHGCGIPDDVLPRVFDPFFTTKKHGTGLGLAIAYRIVNAHGGRLAARNRPAGGCEFTMVLPLLTQEYGRRSDAAVRADVDAA